MKENLKIETKRTTVLKARSLKELLIVEPLEVLNTVFVLCYKCDNP